MIVPPSKQRHALYDSLQRPGILVAIDHRALGCILEEQRRCGRDLKVKKRKDSRSEVLDERDDGSMSTTRGERRAEANTVNRRTV